MKARSKSVIFLKAAVAACALLFSSAGISIATAQSKLSMTVLGPARPPMGFVQFCRTNPKECVSKATTPRQVKLTPTVFTDLDELNRRINTQVAPITDMELYGVNEYWTLPTTAGDCEDYVLLKRKVLHEAGWPEEALLVTVVRDEKGDGHAVLSVTTDQGDMILDNQNENIRNWKDTPYSYVKRQSQTNPRMWVMLGEDAPSAGVATAGQELRR
jgi:predicted transglutaminase-like cysteine proteinase